MNGSRQHSWDVAPDEAKEIQQRLRSQVITANHLAAVRTVAGVDVGFPDPNTARAAVVVLKYPDLVPVDVALAHAPVQFPYIPGLLAFREVPVVLQAVEKLQIRPDLFIFDAHGLAHPRRMGLASHAGLLLDAPSVGCAKRRLVGEYQEPGPARGDSSPLLHDGEVVGVVLRTRTGVRPVFVSIGHRIDLDTAAQFVLNCARYRLPETTRYAHRAAAGQEITLEGQTGGTPPGR